MALEAGLALDNNVANEIAGNNYVGFMTSLPGG
jgi:hypothetical protein